MSLNWLEPAIKGSDDTLATCASRLPEQIPDYGVQREHVCKFLSALENGLVLNLSNGCWRTEVDVNSNVTRWPGKGPAGWLDVNFTEVMMNDSLSTSFATQGNGLTGSSPDPETE